MTLRIINVLQCLMQLQRLKTLYKNYLYNILNRVTDACEHGFMTRRSTITKVNDTLPMAPEVDHIT